VIKIEFSQRQDKIIEIVKKNQPITGENIANKLNLTRGTIRPDLAILTMLNILEAKPKIGYFYNENYSKNYVNKFADTKIDEIKALPVVIKSNTTIYDASVAMFLENVGTLFVVDENFLVGILSRKDLLKASLSGGNPSDIPVNVVMTRLPQIVHCSPEDSILDAVSNIIEYEVDCLPIVKKKEKGFKVIGRVSKTIIINYLYETIR
jgi:CBS domain-containing protein